MAPLFTIVWLDRAIEPSTTSAPAFTTGRPGVGIGAGERQYSAAHLHQGTARSARCAAVANRPADRGAEIVAADDERVRAEEVSSCARDRAGRHRGQDQTRHVEYATRLGGERGIAAGAELGKLRRSAGVGNDGRIARATELGKLCRAEEVRHDGRIARCARIRE